LSQLLGKASPRFPRPADLQAAAARTRSQRQGRAAKPRERAAATSKQSGWELCRGRSAVTARAAKHTQNLLFMVENTFSSHGQG